MRFADALLMLFLLALGWSFYRAQRDPANVINLFDLVLDKGRINRIAVAFMVTLCVTSWVIIRLALDGKLTEGFFAGYAAAWITPMVAKLFSTPQPPGTTITDTTDSSKTVTSTVEAKPLTPENSI